MDDDQADQLLWLLRRKGEMDETKCIIVRATNPRNARQHAQGVSWDRGINFPWTDHDFATCEVLTEPGEPGVVCLGCVQDSSGTG